MAGRTWFSSKFRTKREIATEVGQREIRISALLLTKMLGTYL